MNKYLKVIFDNKYRFKVLSKLGLKNNMSDEKYLKKLYKIEMNKDLNLNNPITYNEKLQWLKLYDRNPIYTKLVDKYEVKSFVEEIIGPEYLIPTIGVWDKFEDINFNNFPKKFVIKCTHDSGGVVICKDKNFFNIKKSKKIINSSLKRNFFYTSREWPYKNIKPRIIAENYIEENDSGQLNDYKFFCFDGVVKLMFIASERQNKNEETKFDFYDREFNHLNLINGHPNSHIPPQKPNKYEEMIILAEKLSKSFKHVRVDFYEANGKIFFGEMTFYHWSGLVPFEPEEWDYKIGSWLKL